jgi:hypothetical protein
MSKKTCELLGPDKLKPRKNQAQGTETLKDKGRAKQVFTL